MEGIMLAPILVARRDKRSRQNERKERLKCVKRLILGLPVGVLKAYSPYENLAPS